MPLLDTKTFQTAFDTDVKRAYQRSGTGLSNWLYKKTKIGASTIRFQKMEAITDAIQKPRHGEVIAANAARDFIDVPVEEWGHSEYVESIDELKTDVNLREDTAANITDVIRRKEEDIITSAMALTTNISSDAATAVTVTGMTFNKVRTAVRVLNGNNVPGSERYGLLSEFQYNNLLTLDEFRNRDLVKEVDMPLRDVPQMFRWLGVTWMVHTGLPTVVGTGAAVNDVIRQALVWHKRAVGVGYATDIQSQVAWIPERRSTLLDAFISLGSSIIEDRGVVAIETNETEAP